MEKRERGVEGVLGEVLILVKWFLFSRSLIYKLISTCQIYYCLDKLKQDIKLAAKALTVSKLMAIFHPKNGKL